MVVIVSVGNQRKHYVKAIGHGNGESEYYEEGNDGSNDDGYIFNWIKI